MSKLNLEQGQQSSAAEKTKRPIKSYVIRGRRIKKSHQANYTRYAHDYLLQVSSQYKNIMGNGLSAGLDLNSIFKRDNPKILEIGFGMGQSLLECAIKNPNYDYIGIEVHQPGVANLISSAHHKSCKNIKIINHDAVEMIKNYIIPESLDKIQVFFPDPWPKARHHKRRLLNRGFLNSLATKLKRNKCLHIATDHAQYAEFIQSELMHCPQLVPISNFVRGGLSQLDQDLINDATRRPTTKYELRGKTLGHDIVDIVSILKPDTHS